MADPRRSARIAAILSVYGLSCAGLYLGLGGAIWLGIEAVLTSAAIGAAALWMLRRSDPGGPMPRVVVAINVATGAVIAGAVLILVETGRQALAVPAAVLVMAAHFAPIAWAQRALAPVVLGLALAVIGVFSLARGGAQANAWAAGLSAVAFSAAALHQLLGARSAQTAISRL